MRWLVLLVATGALSTLLSPQAQAYGLLECNAHCYDVNEATTRGCDERNAACVESAQTWYDLNWKQHRNVCHEFAPPQNPAGDAVQAVICRIEHYTIPRSWAKKKADCRETHNKCHDRACVNEDNCLEGCDWMYGDD